MKIAQIVISKTKNGGWKLAVMSLKRTEKVEIYNKGIGPALSNLENWMQTDDWEELSL